MDAFTLLLLAGVGLAAVPALTTPKPTKDEFARRDAWVKEHMGRPKPGAPPAAAAAPRSGLLVIANHGPILHNGRPDGRRIKLADTEFTHGLICHAPSKVVVSLPGPAARFEAKVGVDANAGGGTVVFSVTVAGRAAFRSEVLRGGGPGVPVSVDLGGAREFTIEAADAGDGIACDHADWADATVTMADGSAIRLADLQDLTLELSARTASAPPFSFTYGGKHSDRLLPGWQFAETVEKLDGARARRTQTYQDPRTGLEVRCVAVIYTDFPTVEWTVTLRNSGTADTPLIESVQALDATLRRPAAREFALHRFVGSPCQENDYQPIEEPMGPNAIRRVTAAGGRPTNSDLCYFNVDWSSGGVIAALGWPGQWAATFARDASDGMRLVAGQETTRLVLHPGEEIRTPLVALQFWQGGDWIRAQNTWRRWMVAHNLPRPGGKLVSTHYGGCFGNPLPRAEEEIAQIDGYERDGVKLDYWFIDAGWYPCAGSWTNTGTWEPDPERFPKGLRQVADVLHAKDVKFIVWFEPERVAAGSWLAENHPEWILGGKQGGVFNIGDPAARRWMMDRVDGLITKGGVDVYRTDHNIDPLSYWQSNDAENRMGMTENQCVTGILAFWDELLRRHPDMYIDTCASGGRRNDLETLRRSVPLLRSDWAVASFNAAGAIGQQAQTYGISFWMPYHGTGSPSGDPYVMRSSYVPAFRMGWDATDPKRDPAMLQRSVAEFRRIARYMLDDFYPLTPYSLEKTAWMAWQYDRPGPGEGAIQAFRREESVEDAMTLKLCGLAPSATYVVEDLDGGATRKLSGRTLMQEGLAVSISAKPGSALFLYRKAR